MFMRAWSWLLYGEKRFFVYAIYFAVIGLLLSGYFLLQPIWQSYQYQYVQSVSLIDKIESQKNILDTYQQESGHSTVLMSWSSLGAIYQMAIRISGKRIYFAGDTDQILGLLIFVLNDAYDISGFHLERSNQKTVLAISL